MRFVPGFSALDFTLGLRMLRRYPGITTVGTVAIAVAVALGSAYFEATDKFLRPRLDIPRGARVVSLLEWDVAKQAVESRAMHDFATWRAQLKTVESVGASNAFVRNLDTGDGRVEPVRGAELTANAFWLMGTPPLLGRTLLDRDEKLAALRVKWLKKFQAAVPAKTAATAIQLDRRLGAVTEVQLSSRIPLIR